MTLPTEVRSDAEEKLKVTIRHFNPVAGGCINNGGRLTTDGGSFFFIKWNSLEKFPSMFEMEAKGLRLLKQHGSLEIPQPVAYGKVNALQYLVLEWMGGERRSKEFWPRLGTGLAALHRNTSKSFGLDHDNYIGALPQSNKPTSGWPTFFAQQRIEPQLKMLKADAAMRRSFERLLSRIGEIFPPTVPALLHGDLWSGNLIVGTDGLPCLIDPAVHYGHRESELAFTRLFGGFDTSFYDAYDEVFPLDPGFEERVEILNLYPLLVHANLFGGHYVQEIRAILRPWA